ncbi:NADH dehydrogenase [Agrobacterium fabacearum CFBP 5771]|jgi:NADH dehydrogenase|uniref:NAD(P)/FAD-dependent oxidoreductase n=2 Tax=Agrobacterium tumefaciens complex TaxID=1183400 RepID=A0A4D7Z5X7_AGRTU|nr:NAD(P)/FAD-dependent oxidoreductase [Agrobacterium tumefaciens]QCL98214.1 NAD(P)/FAD-dependent oxidoreductase [Agrobacterium tumefaciens]CVI24765.1 NADH dehydrogenase [Agrobacterium fabacearum CFBP 5771]
MNRENARHHIVVAGGGIAGLELATMLARKNRHRANFLSVTLVDRDWAHVWKPMLHTIAAGTRDISQQQTPYLAQAHNSGFSFEPGEICGLDRNAHEIKLAALHSPDGRLLVPERTLGYDTLVIALGSQANDFATRGVSTWCRRIDSRQQAQAFNQEIRFRILQCLAQDRQLSIGIVGGGATGVELAAELVQLTETSVAYGAHDLASRISITLIEAGPKLLPAFPEDISAATLHHLQALGVKVMTQAQVGSVDEHGFVLCDGTRIEASLKVWAAGVKAADFLNGFGGLESNRANQLLVKPSLQSTLDPDIYAVGDCASLQLPGMERPLPPTAQIAHQQAHHLIRHLPGAVLQGTPVPNFRHRDFGALVSLGEYGAYGSLGRFGFFKETTIRGRLAQFGHIALYRSHQARLHGMVRGSLLWLVDSLNSRLRARIRLD